VELDSLPALKEYQKFVKCQGVQIQSSLLSKTGTIGNGIGFHMSIKIPKGMKHADAIELLSNHEGINLIEEV